jgi:hypothetical protein
MTAFRYELAGLACSRPETKRRPFKIRSDPTNMIGKRKREFDRSKMYRGMDLKDWSHTFTRDVLQLG